MVGNWLRTVGPATVTGVKWIYHRRVRAHCWGCKVEMDNGEDTGLTLVFIPQGFARKVQLCLAVGLDAIERQANLHRLAVEIIGKNIPDLQH